jgi:hypothetical protein
LAAFESATRQIGNLRYNGIRLSVFAAVSLLALASAFTLPAAISEPDNVIYGSMVISNTPVTAADTDVVIEARRTESGPAIASYRMGSDDRLGSFYSLALPIESVGEVSDPNASTTGQQVFIVVTAGSAVVGQTSYTFAGRGHVQRVDFGAPLEDADGNGLPDLWELTWLGTAASDPNALGLNGQTLMANYIAGTDPEDPDDVFEVEIGRAGGQVEVAFLARRAEGPGYEGKVRRYTLESNPAPGSDQWTPVPGFQNLSGANQMVLHQPAGVAPTSIYRGRVMLTNAAALQVPGGPRLAIARVSGNSIRLSWPSGSTGFMLQESTNLGGGNWSDVGVTPVDDGAHWSVVLNPPDDPSFYRLRQ